jgi:hypothetical protein
MTSTDQLAGKLLDIINQVQSTVTNHAADAVNLVLLSTQIDGLTWLMFSILPFCASLIFTYFLVTNPKCKANRKNDEFGVDGFFVLLTILLGIFMLCNIFYIWNWIQVFSPKLYLAHEIIQKVMQ